MYRRHYIGLEKGVTLKFNHPKLDEYSAVVY